MQYRKCKYFIGNTGVRHNFGADFGGRFVNRPYATIINYSFPHPLPLDTRARAVLQYFHKDGDVMGKPDKEKKKREQKRLAEKKDPVLQAQREQKKQANFKKGAKSFLHSAAKTLLPAILCILIFGLIYKNLPVSPHNGAFGINGFVGAALLGVGISLFLYGKTAYKFLALVGIALAVLSCFLVCKAKPADGKTILFYYYNIFATFVYFLMYVVAFRFSVERWLRGRKISMTMIRKSKTGAKNLWWYKELHRNFGLSSVYTLNKMFTIFLLVHLTASVFLGWEENLIYPFCISLTLLALLCSALLEFSRIQTTIDRYGCKFVWCKLICRHGRIIDSSILDFIFIVLFPLGFAAVLWLIMYRY